MKKAIKLLSLAMLFALPLAACGNNDNGGGSQSGGSGSGDSGGGSGSGGGGSGGGGGGSGGGGGGSSLTAKGEATRIAAEMYGIDEDEVTFADYEDEEAEGDVYKYESSKLSFYMTGYYDDEMSYDEMVSDIKSFMPSGAKKNSTYSYDEEDLSEDDFTYIYFDEVYTKDGLAYNVIVDYYEDDEYGIDASASICVLKESQLAAYDEYFSSEGDDDWDDDDDWGDDDDDEGGGGGTVIEGADTLSVDDLISPEKPETYTEFSGIDGDSGAEYSGKCALSSTQNGSCIQIRQKNSDSGIYSSKSAGTVSSISVSFGPTNTHDLVIVASNSAFSSTSALFSATKVGTIAAGSTGSYTFDDDYSYFGLISSNGAVYIDSFSVVWNA